ncbi:hypothetical protein [Clostridium sp. BJN0013]|uniref:hypothetical protein n=1 Tax=Clostridium sp. BJN0013 TaxID=3236840 RepID=UPI0034C684AC
MNRTKKILSSILFLLIVFFSVGCGNTTGSSDTKKSDTSTKKVTLTISAAASLKDSMNEIKERKIFRCHDRQS